MGNVNTIKELFVWSDVLYSVNNKTIDAQHKKLINILNKLYTLYIGGDYSQEDIADVLSELKDYTVYHFNTEEKLFKEKGYPQIDEHKAIHANFVTEINNFVDSYNKNPKLLTMKIFTFLQKWLKGHILGDDKKYVPWLKD